MRNAPARLLAAMLLFAASAWSLGAEPVTEASVKAAFLYKFCGYVDWLPARFASPAAPFVIGVLHDDEVAAQLERLVPGRSVETHPVVVRRIKSGESVANVQVLFIGGEHPDRGAVRAAEQAGALVVTESPNGLDAGSAINFLVADEHVGFEVSLEAAQRSGHRISARMLSVARRVVQKGA